MIIKKQGSLDEFIDTLLENSVIPSTTTKILFLYKKIIIYCK